MAGNKFNFYGKGKRRVPGEMNKTEAAYAAILDQRIADKEIIEYKYEAMTLKLAKQCSYTPDFWVLENNYEISFHEIKGAFIHSPSSIVKLKTAAEIFPFRFVLAQLIKKDQWEISEVGRKAG